MFSWNPATEHFYAPADIYEGLVVADFGCGPGHAAIEFAKRVGPNGHVHALDINRDFIQRTAARIERHGLIKRVTTHLLSTPGLPLVDGSLDRVTARNTIIYVAEPLETAREFRRVLRPGGLVHAIESDWTLTAVEPVPQHDWNAIIDAAGWAWPHPTIGRQLYGILKSAGFEDVRVQLMASPDTDGRLLDMIKTVAGYARESLKLSNERISSILNLVEHAVKDGTYLAISPQFVVTARN